MPYKIEVEGTDELFAKLGQIGKRSTEVASKAVYQGAGLVADAIKNGARGIATKRFKYKVKEGQKRMPSPEEKALVMNASGIAKFRKDGNTVDTIIGYTNTGYGTIRGKKVPIPMIARSINSGTSFMNKQPFIRKAISQSKNAAAKLIEQEMEKEADKLIREEIG